MNTNINENGLDRSIRISRMISENSEDENSFFLTEALEFSLEWSDAYFQQRFFKRICMTYDAVATLAAARLEWLLRAGATSLNGVVSIDDFIVLCNTFQDSIASPADLMNPASYVADDLGLEPDTYRESIFGPLIDKLAGLSVLQQVALRDLVERYWYIGAHEFPSMSEFLIANGIDPAVSASP